MNLTGLLGKYLRLQQELAGASEPAHRQRIVDEMRRLERRLAEAGVSQFSDTRPLEEA